MPLNQFQWCLAHRNAIFVPYRPTFINSTLIKSIKLSDKFNNPVFQLWNTVGLKQGRWVQLPASSKQILVVRYMPFSSTFVNCVIQSGAAPPDEKQLTLTPNPMQIDSDILKIWTIKRRCLGFLDHLIFRQLHSRCSDASSVQLHVL